MPSTRSQVSRSKVSRDNAISLYSTQLEAYSKEYMVSFDGSESVDEWSSRHAQRFSTTVNNCVPLAVIKRDLAKVVSKVVPASRVTVTRYHLANTTADLDWSEGRSKFNKFLFSEFENWYSAFEAEADEDESHDAASAASRWVYHCAKKLSRSGLSASQIVPVVEAWLNTHLDS